MNQGRQVSSYPKTMKMWKEMVMSLNVAHGSCYTAMQFLIWAQVLVSGIRTSMGEYHCSHEQEAATVGVAAGTH